MRPTILIDSSSDLPASYVKEMGVSMVSLTYTLEDNEYVDDLFQSMNSKDFYAKVRNGAMPTTSLVNTERFLTELKPYAISGESVLYIAFSSALSGTYQCAVSAIEMLKEDYPECDIIAFDTKAASGGEGLLVRYALEMRDAGKSRDEILDWLKENHLKMNHWFVVEDLHHLHRGGRLSKATAIVGTMLKLKPSMVLGTKGEVIAADKIKGRKKSIRFLVEKLKEKIVNPDGQTIVVSHADCQGEADALISQIREAMPTVGDIHLNIIGPVIGAHTGASTLGVFFMGEERH